jgi:hypothetical protein
VKGYQNEEIKELTEEDETPTNPDINSGEKKRNKALSNVQVMDPKVTFHTLGEGEDDEFDSMGTSDSEYD